MENGPLARVLAYPDLNMIDKIKNEQKYLYLIPSLEANEKLMVHG